MEIAGYVTKGDTVTMADAERLTHINAAFPQLMRDGPASGSLPKSSMWRM
jgi:hypothetical protein